MTTDERLPKLVLATPAEGKALINPPLSELVSVWKSNRDKIAATSSAEIQIANRSLSELRSTARAELIQLASAYSASYGVNFPVPAEANIVMAGHQPELFHSGVWFKNFLLSRLVGAWNAVGINLVVDNDLCGSTAIRIPHMDGQRATTLWTEFDGPGASVPYEERRLQDWQVFENFAERTVEKIGPFVGRPIVRSLWPHVIEAACCFESGGDVNLGAAIAAGRHRLEAERGLRTLEVPLSQIAATESFSTFIAHAFIHHHRLREVYNRSLADYRETYQLRSRSHPVPELEQREAMIETPFWIWHRDSPDRKRLFVQHLDTTFLLHDGEGWSSEIKEKWTVDDLQFLEQQGIKIRPRALMTTLYSRLVLSDLFIHGIGGAKYDQLTDLIAERFLGVALPAYCTASATERLPTGTPAVVAADITSAEQQLRELSFHPERMIELANHPAAQELAAIKSQWIEVSGDFETRRRRHHDIERCNRALQPLVAERREQLLKTIENLQQQYRAYQVLGSREFSFCLFPESLVEKFEA